MMASLSSRLSWGLLLSLIFLLSLQWVAATYAISQLTENQLLDRLQREGESILAYIRFDENGTLQFDSQHLSNVYQRPFSGHYYVVVSKNQKHISRSLWDEDLHVANLTVGQKQVLHMAGPEKQPLLVIAHGYQKQQRPITIIVAEDIGPLQQSLARFQMIYAAVSFTGLILLLLLQRLIVSFALKPLQEIQRNMVQLGRGEVERIQVLGPSEIMPLIEGLNNLLTGLQQRTRRSREALGNLSHALKTQLTLLNQVAERPEMDAYPAVRQSIYQSTNAAEQIIERELKRARLVGETYRGRHIDLKAEVAQLAHTLRLLYQTKQVNILWEVSDDSKFYGDREDLLEMLGNLLDNACKWCSSKVSMNISGNAILLFIIEDDGPGCHAADIEVLTCRGFRADETKPGSGLGLAIAHDIVESYHGSLTFGRSTVLGGLRVEVRLPQKNL